jgi:peroxiredoxin Q/BCP
MLQVGKPAPAFDLPDADLEMVSLAGFHGKRNVVLYFYPKDDTPGCTIEAIDFSDLQDEFEKHETVVLGISMDDCISHGSFRDKHGLSVRLLADTEGEACSAYGVLVERESEGRKRIGIQRSTFVIDRQGVLRHVMYGVNARGHAAEVLALLKSL